MDEESATAKCGAPMAQNPGRCRACGENVGPVNQTRAVVFVKRNLLLGLTWFIVFLVALVFVGLESPGLELACIALGLGGFVLIARRGRTVVTISNDLPDNKSPDQP